MDTRLLPFLFLAPAAIAAQLGSRSSPARADRVREALDRVDRLLSRPSGSLRRGSLAAGKRISPVDELVEAFRDLDPVDIPTDRLLAVLLHGATGRRPPLDVAREILDAQGGVLKMEREAVRVAGASGHTEIGQLRMTALFELARRMRTVSPGPLVEIRGSADVYRIYGSSIIGPYEQLLVLFLDRRNRVITTRIVTRGSDGHTIVDPKQVLRTALFLGANGLILVHNHPSGDKTFSINDLEVTEKLQRAAIQLSIQVVDHLVVVPGDYSSMLEQGILRTPWAAYAGSP